MVTYTNSTPLRTGTGNVAVDPLFAASGPYAWDYYALQSGSPVGAAGSTSGPMGAVLGISDFQRIVPELSAIALMGLSIVSTLVASRFANRGRVTPHFRFGG
jgi:hypothetical protein